MILKGDGSTAQDDPSMSSKSQADTGQDLTSRAEWSQRRQSSWDQQNGGTGKGQRPELHSCKATT